ncbi:YhcH/YjgK/YiaL family protein [Puniceicoccus vermicola]|uniref:YhcH/YjgK/YiaL family protein n=1 Tax=Puniceicoccus vermicola TaxID=388746 RepID=A0A7X1AWJ2_9BACT|nr:YhcH/YjgK/YiaL family protein [Puniceicoccus vermicola]
MLYANHKTPSTYRPLLTSPAWRKVLDWMDHRDPELPDGIYPIEGDDIFVNQHRYETLPREECRWESHRRYIDLQFCLEGTEIIDVIDRDFLTDDGPYDEEKDLLFHNSPPFPKEGGTGDSRWGGSSIPTSPSSFLSSDPQVSDSSFLPLLMTPGRMAIFTPTDAHRPKVSVNQPTPVRKFVVKISLEAIR